jgi:hypothetical protein
MIASKPRAGRVAVTALASMLTIAAVSESRAGYRVNVAHPMPTLRAGTPVAGPASQARLPQARPDVTPVGTVRAAEPEPARVTHAVILRGVPSRYYYGTATYYAPGYYGGQYYDGGPALGPSPISDDGAADCLAADGKLRPCP